MSNQTRTYPGNRTLRELVNEEVEWVKRDREEPIHYIRFGTVEFAAECYDDDGKGLVADLRRELGRIIEQATESPVG